MKNKEIEELLKNCKIWVKTDDIDYTRWFGLYELSLLIIYIEQLENNRDKVINILCEVDSNIMKRNYAKVNQIINKAKNILKGDGNG